MLSERDKRVLADIERWLIEEDPALDEVLRLAPSRSWRLREARLLVIGFLALVASVVPGAGPLAFLFGLVLTIYSLVRLLWAEKDITSPKAARPRRQDPAH